MTRNLSFWFLILSNRLYGRKRVSALLTTLIALLLVLLPVSVTLLLAGSQVLDMVAAFFFSLIQIVRERVERSTLSENADQGTLHTPTR